MVAKPYGYKFTPLAEQDIDEIFAYISVGLSAPQAAVKTIDVIQAAVERICQFPFSCPLLNEALLRERGFRMLVVDNFNIFYTTKDEIIVIMRVLYSRRNYENLID
ncbi:MAG: type II toxin-antitoxin system RelE/ParE family toxin [Firmicutes bacterium]|nr:type II toxin-antitoxin system RelE/ParE family toxin [Bacillota bacterium]